MARLVRKEDRGPMEFKVGNESKWLCMCGLSNNQLSAMVHIKRQPMKKQEKFTDIILTEHESKLNKFRNVCAILLEKFQQIS